MHLVPSRTLSTAPRRLSPISPTLVLGLIAWPIALNGVATAQAGSPVAATAAARPRPAIAFAENRGQWDQRASYMARMGALTAYLEDRGWVFTLVEPADSGAREPSTLGKAVRDEAPPALRGVAVRMRFAGGSHRPTQEPEHPQPGWHHYLLGNDPAGWRTHVPLYASVRYHDLYPGVDLRLREAASTLEYDLLLDPGADLSRVQVAVEGVEGLRLTDDGALVLDTALGPVVQPPPMTWQVDARGREHPVACGYVLLGRDRFGFVAPERDIDCALVVDPKLVYSTYLGGGDFEYVADIAVDGAGRALVVGRSLSTNYPTTAGAFRPVFNGGPWDGFVTVMNATGTALAYSTFLGGNDTETVFAGKLDAGGIAHLAGGTWSTDFPTTPGAYDTTHNGTRDAFHARLSPDGSTLVYSTLLGSAANDAAFAIEIDAAGQVATICGQAGDGLPTTPNAYQPVHGGSGFLDGFVARLDPSQPMAQQLVYSTFLGADLADYAQAFVQDAHGVLTIVGGTTSSSFPTTAGAYQASSQGGWDCFASRLDPSLPPAQQLLWSTYFGGSLDDYPSSSIDVGPQGVTVCGTTMSGNLPTTPGTYSPTFNGGASDAFLSRLDPSQANARQLVWSTFLGASADDQSGDMTIDAVGRISVVGWTQWPGAFPTTPGALKRVRGLNQGFVSVLDPAASRLLYSTYLGGSHHEGAWYVAAGQTGVVTVTGASTSPDFPTTPGAWNTVRNDPGYTIYDAFVTRLQTVPTGVRRYGDVSRDCAGRKPTIHALDDALAGSTSFGLATSQGPPNAAAVLLISFGPAAGVPVLGVQAYVDLGALAVALALTSNAAGETALSIPIPGQTTGTVYVQVALADLAGCPQRPLSATDAQVVTW